MDQIRSASVQSDTIQSSNEKDSSKLNDVYSLQEFGVINDQKTAAGHLKDPLETNDSDPIRKHMYTEYDIKTVEHNSNSQTKTAHNLKNLEFEKKAVALEPEHGSIYLPKELLTNEGKMDFKKKDIKAVSVENGMKNTEEEEFGSNLVQQRKKRQKQQAQRKITSVYVTGLPQDVTLDELNGHFKTCGIILPDLETGLPKIKIYEGADGKPKGDALIIYLKEESVQLAEKLLDESMIRPGVQINVQQATFTKKEPVESRIELDFDTKRKLRKIHKKLEWF